MKKVKHGKTVFLTPRKIEGVEIVEVETGKVLGIFTGSVGEYGTSTGIFTHATHTAPFAEFGLELVK